MNSKECEEQLNSLIDHFNNGGLDFNATDIEAIKHLMLENKMQHDTINTQKFVIGHLGERIDKALDYIEKNVYKEENGCGLEWWEIYSKEELLEILKGGSNE